MKASKKITRAIERGYRPVKPGAVGKTALVKRQKARKKP